MLSIWGQVILIMCSNATVITNGHISSLIYSGSLRIGCCVALNRFFCHGIYYSMEIFTSSLSRIWISSVFGNIERISSWHFVKLFFLILIFVRLPLPIVNTISLAIRLEILFNLPMSLFYLLELSKMRLLDFKDVWPFSLPFFPFVWLKFANLSWIRIENR